MRDLQAFLIKRFIYILVLVTIAQSLISFLISQAVMPVVMKVFFPDYQRQSSVGKTDLFIFIICVLLLLIEKDLQILMQSPLQGMMQWTGERLQDWLVDHARHAIREYHMDSFAIAGGVASNGVIRAAMEQMCREEGVKFYHPSPILCTDNAAMIGAAAYYDFIAGKRAGLDLNAVPNLKLGE